MIKNNINTQIPECTFCNINKTKFENTILDETKYFYIIPSLGSIVEGYILIISKRHINSMLELTIAEMNEYRELIQKYRDVFKQIYKYYPIVFEHGNPDLNDEMRVNTVVHAHTHIVNHQYKNENKLLQRLKFNKITKMRVDLKSNYIFYINPNGEEYITYDFEPISQIMRIEIAKDLNLVDKYDWDKNRFDDNIALTINKIKDYLYNEKGSDNMKNIILYVPALEDYWYEQKVQSDPLTMSYNAGYNVSYDGYHYDTGCIDFPKEKWKETLEKRVNENRYFAYIKDDDINEYVGYVNYHYNKNNNRYECGIVIESKYRGKGYSETALKMLCDVARDNGVKELYDSFELDRNNTLNIFKSVGFEIIQEQSWKKFKSEVNGVLVKIIL